MLPSGSGPSIDDCDTSVGAAPRSTTGMRPELAMGSESEAPETPDSGGECRGWPRTAAGSRGGRRPRRTCRELTGSEGARAGGGRAGNVRSVARNGGTAGSGGVRAVMRGTRDRAGESGGRAGRRRVATPASRCHGLALSLGIEAVLRVGIGVLEVGEERGAVRGAPRARARRDRAGGPRQPGTAWVPSAAARTSRKRPSAWRTRIFERAGLGIEEPVLAHAEGGIVVLLLDAIASLVAGGVGDDLHDE